MKTFFRRFIITIFLLLAPFSMAYALNAPEPPNVADTTDPATKEGHNLSQAGKYREAIAKYSKTIAKQPDNIEAHIFRAFAYFHIDDHESAIRDYTRVITLNPSMPSAYHGRGVSLFLTGKSRQALDDYTKAIQLKPDFFDAYYNRGNAHLALKEYDSAIVDYNTALRLQAIMPLAYFQRGNAYAAKGLYDNAIKNFTTAIEQDPANETAHYRRGNAYQKTGNLSGAIGDYTKVIELDPEYSLAYSKRGLSHLFQKDYTKALADFNMALELKPDGVYYQLRRFIAIKRGGGTDDGRVFEAFASEFPRNKWIANVLDLYTGKISPETCIASAADSDPETDAGQKCEAYYYTGQYYLWNNQPEKAKAMFQACLNTGVTRFTEYLSAGYALKNLQ